MTGRPAGRLTALPSGGDPLAKNSRPACGAGRGIDEPKTLLMAPLPWTSWHGDHEAARDRPRPYRPVAQQTQPHGDTAINDRAALPRRGRRAAAPLMAPRPMPVAAAIGGPNTV